MDRCTTRVAFAYFRQKSRRPAMEGLQEVPTLVPGAEERTALREAARHLYAELDRLEPGQRLAFTLYAIENMPIKQIAEITESSAGATKLRVWRARRTIEKRAKRDPLLAEFLSAGGEAKEVE
jgi:RNA polymerase sigma-70 factor (ECF subfamily)